MEMGYDDWLQQPYQDSYALSEEYDRISDDYIGSDDYKKAFAEWKEENENPDATEDDFIESSSFEGEIERIMAM